MHSYGRMWMFPYGHTDDLQKCVRAPDHDQLVITSLYVKLIRHRNYIIVIIIIILSLIQESCCRRETARSRVSFDM